MQLYETFDIPEKYKTALKIDVKQMTIQITT